MRPASPAPCSPPSTFDTGDALLVGAYLLTRPWPAQKPRIIRTCTRWQACVIGYEGRAVLTNWCPTPPTDQVHGESAVQLRRRISILWKLTGWCRNYRTYGIAGSGWEYLVAVRGMKELVYQPATSDGVLPNDQTVPTEVGRTPAADDSSYA
jgi:hypothetical protein